MLLWTIHIWAIVEVLHHHQLVDFASFRYLNVIDDLAKPPLSMRPESGWIRNPPNSKIKYIQQEKEREKIWRTCYLPSCCMRLWDQKRDKTGSMGHWPFYRLVICAAQWKWASVHPAWPNFASNFLDTMLALSVLVLRLEMAPFWLEKARSCKCVG